MELSAQEVKLIKSLINFYRLIASQLFFVFNFNISEHSSLSNVLKDINDLESKLDRYLYSD